MRLSMSYGNLDSNENARAPTVFVVLLPDAVANQRVRHRGETAS